MRRYEISGDVCEDAREGDEGVCFFSGGEGGVCGEESRDTSAEEAVFGESAGDGVVGWSEKWVRGKKEGEGLCEEGSAWGREGEACKKVVG